MPEETIKTPQDGDEQILVTGAAGLVGNELVKQLLQKGSKVKAIYNNKPLLLSHPNLEKVRCDILDVMALDEVMQGITNVYHCAAIVSFDPKEKYRLLKINVEGTSNVINSCIDANVKKLLHVSSVAALGKATNGEAITENENHTENSRTSVYGKSKHLAELEVWRGQAEGLNTVIINPTIILGGDDWNSGSSAKQLLTN
jgi:nucleoside-diphosphate-sugar epimerase